MRIIILLGNERDNDKKTKHGNATYFVELVFEDKFGKSNFISSKALKVILKICRRKRK